MRSESTLTIALLTALACTSGSASRPAGQASSAGDSPRENALVVAVPAPEAEPALAEAGPSEPVLTGASSWTQFHGDAARRGASAAPPISSPKLAWRARVGIQGWLNSPIVIGGTVLVPSSGSVHNAPDPEDGLGARDTYCKPNLRLKSEA
jgi:hypothetical protein